MAFHFQFLSLNVVFTLPIVLTIHEPRLQTIPKVFSVVVLIVIVPTMKYTQLIKNSSVL